MVSPSRISTLASLAAWASCRRGSDGESANRLAGEPALLRWYPVLLNGLLLALFGLSLKFGPPLIERLARLSEPQLPEVAVRYTRTVTQVWAGFFLLNGLVVVALNFWAPLSWWTLYTGLIAYGLMGLLFAGEWLVRQHVRRYE